MKLLGKTTLAATLILFSIKLNAQQPVNPWLEADRIVEEIGSVKIPENKILTISTKNAKNATKAINNAILACSKAGGGLVITPCWHFLPVRLCF